MCGIAGISATRAVSRQAVEAMNDHLRRRGPDGEGVWVSPDARVALGNRRLSIIDPTPAGAQPMVSDDGDFVLTFNGEIYNFVEVRERLMSEGARFRSRSDSEVLLKGYETWGDAVLRELNGMFAFAIYDRRLAADAGGALFVCEDRDQIADALDVIARGGFPPADPAVLAEYTWRARARVLDAALTRATGRPA